MTDTRTLQRMEPQYDSTLEDIANEDAAAGVDLDAIANEVEEPTAAASTSKPTDRLNASIQYWDFVQAKTQMNDEGLKQAGRGLQVKARGGEGWEEAMKPTPEMEQASATAEEFKRQNDLDKHILLNFLADSGAAIPSMVPFMGELAKGAGIGVGFGVASSVVAGALTEGAGLATIPYTASAGATIGSVSIMGQLAEGQTYLDMRAKGLSHDHAAAMSSGSGLIQGMLGAIPINRIAGGLVGEAAKVQLGGWQKMMQQYLTSQVKGIPEIGLAGATQASAAVVKYMGEGMAALLDSKPAASPMTLEGAAQEWGKAFAESMATFTGIVAGGKTAAFGTGATMRLAALNAKRTTRKIKDQLNDFKAKVSEEEKAFEAERQAQEEQSLIDAINEAAEEAAKDLLADKPAKKPKTMSKTATEKERIATEKKAKRDAAEKEIRRIFKMVADRKQLLQLAKDMAENYDGRKSDLREAIKDEYSLGEGKAEASAVQRVLKALVANSDVLDDKMKVRLFKRVIEIDSEADLLREGEKFIKDMRTREYQNRVKEALAEVQKAVDFNPVEDNGKSKFGKHISEEYVQPAIEAFNTFKAMIADEMLAGTKEYQGLAIKAVEAYGEAQAKNKDPYPFEMAARIGAQLAGLKEKTPKVLEGLAEHIENLKEEGLAAAELGKVKEQILVKAVRDIALQALQAGKKVPIDLTQADPALLNRLYKDLTEHGGSTAAGFLFTWGGLMRWVSMYQKDPGMFLKLMDVHEATQRVTTNVRLAQGQYHDLLAKHSPEGTFESAVKLILRGTKAERIGTYEAHPSYVEAKPGRKAQPSLNMTPNQAVKVLMQLKDDQTTTSRIHGNGYTRKGEVSEGMSTEELLEDYFARPDRKDFWKLGQALREFYDSQFQRLSDAVWDEYGQRPVKNEAYSGYLSHNDDKWNSDEDFAKNWGGHITKTVTPSRAGITIERVATPSGMAVRDAFTEAYQQMTLFEQWAEMRKSHKPISAVFGDQGMRNVIKLKFGNQILNAIDVYRRDLVWGPQLKSEGAMGVYNTMLKQYAEVVLLGRPLQFFKQVTGFLGTMQKMDHPEMAEHLKDFFSAPEKNAARFTSRDFFKNRWGNSLQQQIGILAKDGFENTDFAKFKDYAAIPVRYGDAVSSVVTAHIIYKNALRRGLPEAEALIEAERFVNETQSSGTIDQLSNLARNPGLKVFSLLAQQPTRRVEEAVLAINTWLKHPGKENAIQVRRTLTGAMTAAVAYSGVGMTATMLNPLSTDRQKRAAFESFIFSALDPVFGTAGGIGMGTRYGTYDYLNKKFGFNLQVFDPSNPVVNTIKASAEIWGDTEQLSKEPSLKNVSKLTRDLLFGPNVLVPASAAPVVKGIPVLGGLPLMEGQKALEGLADLLEGDE